jgi:hypothetical protein
MRFADCVLDPEARELRRGGRDVPLSPRAFRLLTLLLERRPRPVSQRELRDALWQAHAGQALEERVGGHGAGVPVAALVLVERVADTAVVAVAADADDLQAISREEPLKLSS